MNRRFVIGLLIACALGWAAQSHSAPSRDGPLGDQESAPGRELVEAPYRPPQRSDQVPAPSAWVRQDGGPPSVCNGRADAPASASPNCAWSNPLFAMNPMRLESSDVLDIAPGEYRMGYGMTDQEELGLCPRITARCGPEPLPDRVTILGNGATLVGIGGIGSLLNLSDSVGVTVMDLEITDDEECITGHLGSNPSDYKCDDDDERRLADRASYAATGMIIYNATDVEVINVDIHGIANRCVRFAEVDNALFSNTRMVGCGRAGFDGDRPPSGGGNDANFGVLRFEDVTIAANGCLEFAGLPDEAAFEFEGRYYGQCFGQNRAGYGDGLGLAATGGEWIFERVTVAYNASDGLDLLYLNRGIEPGTYEALGATVQVIDSTFRGNAGSGVKIGRAPAIIRNNVLLGNCWFLNDYGLIGGERCRAGGYLVSLSGLNFADDTVDVVNNTLRGHGDCLVVTPSPGGIVNFRRNAFIGDWDQRNLDSGGDQRVCGHYCDPAKCTGIELNFEDNLFDAARLKDTQCLGDGICDWTSFGDESYDSFAPSLPAGYGANN